MRVNGLTSPLGSTASPAFRLEDFVLLRLLGFMRTRETDCSTAFANGVAMGVPVTQSSASVLAPSANSSAMGVPRTPTGSAKIRSLQRDSSSGMTSNVPSTSDDESGDVPTSDAEDLRSVEQAGDHLSNMQRGETAASLADDDVAHPEAQWLLRGQYGDRHNERRDYEAGAELLPNENATREEMRRMADIDGYAFSCHARDLAACVKVCEWKLCTRKTTNTDNKEYKPSSEGWAVIVAGDSGAILMWLPTDESRAAFVKIARQYTTFVARAVTSLGDGNPHALVMGGMAMISTTSLTAVVIEFVSRHKAHDVLRVHLAYGQKRRLLDFQTSLLGPGLNGERYPLLGWHVNMDVGINWKTKGKMFVLKARKRRNSQCSSAKTYAIFGSAGRGAGTVQLKFRKIRAFKNVTWKYYSLIQHVKNGLTPFSSVPKSMNLPKGRPLSKSELTKKKTAQKGVVMRILPAVMDHRHEHFEESKGNRIECCALDVSTSPEKFLELLLDQDALSHRGLSRMCGYGGLQRFDVLPRYVDQVATKLPLVDKMLWSCPSQVSETHTMRLAEANNMFLGINRNLYYDASSQSRSTKLATTDEHSMKLWKTPSSSNDHAQLDDGDACDASAAELEEIQRWVRVHRWPNGRVSAYRRKLSHRDGNSHRQHRSYKPMTKVPGPHASAAVMYKKIFQRYPNRSWRLHLHPVQECANEVYESPDDGPHLEDPTTHW